MRLMAIALGAALMPAIPVAAVPSRLRGRTPVRAPVRARPAVRRIPTPKPNPVPPVPAHPEFLRDVAPILDRQGCSSAACHGKFGGRGDLALSLLTLAPEDDYAPIVQGARGRRVDLQEPDQSLFLLKPIGQVPHGGGIRFKRGSPEYRTILNWLADGAPFRKEDARVRTLTVTPAQTVLKVGGRTRLKVTAEWSDGRTEDVTRKVMYASADEPVAAVSPEGEVSGVRWGGTAIQVRFLGTVRAAFVTLPQARRDSKPYPDVPRSNLVDTLVFDNLRRMNVLPSELTTDEQFCRRVHLDTTGLLPSPEELDRFLKDSSPDKRRRLIDSLLERPEFADLRALRMADLLRLNPRKINNDAGFGERSVVLFYEWLRENISRNRPYNELVRELLTARGSSYFNGPANYWMIERTPNDRAETTGQAFLGVRLQCARCHKHPFDRWTTDDYWDFSAFHGKVAVRAVPGGAFGEQEVYYNPGVTVTNQSVNGPRRGLPARPTYLGAEPLGDEQLKGDISVSMAEWITGPDNPYFARAAMNRLWSQYFGRGIVHPVDDIRETSPETVPGLLDALAKEFREHGWDVKHMVRLLLNSRAYQLSAAPNESNTLDDRFYAHYYPKPMLAQVLLDVLNQATGVTERLTAFPLERAVELPLPATNSFFLTVFGQSHRLYLADLDPKLEPNLVQTLHMMNSGYVNGKIRAGSFTRELARSESADEEVVRQAFLRTLCRHPSPGETSAALKALSETKTRQEWVEDLLWALISSREFLFVS